MIYIYKSLASPIDYPLYCHLSLSLSGHLLRVTMGAETFMQLLILSDYESWQMGYICHEIQSIDRAIYWGHCLSL
jgi:hypothetical protein